MIDQVKAKQRVDELLANLPHGAKVVIKDGWFWNSLAWIVKVITFGKNSTFGKNYITTIGKTIAMPIKTWDSREADPFDFYWDLSHELKHVEQVYKLGFGNFYLGMFLFAVSYLLLPLPFGVAYCRYKFERDAYVAGFTASVSLMDHDTAQRIMFQDIDNTVLQLTSGLYGWTLGVFPKFARQDITNRYLEAFNEAFRP